MHPLRCALEVHTSMCSLNIVKKKTTNQKKPQKNTPNPKPKNHHIYAYPYMYIYAFYLYMKYTYTRMKGKLCCALNP